MLFCFVLKLFFLFFFLAHSLTPSSPTSPSFCHCLRGAMPTRLTPSFGADVAASQINRAIRDMGHYIRLLSREIVVPYRNGKPGFST